MIMSLVEIVFGALSPYCGTYSLIRISTTMARKSLTQRFRMYRLAVEYYLRGWPWDQAKEIAYRLTDFKVVK